MFLKQQVVAIPRKLIRDSESSVASHSLFTSLCFLNAVFQFLFNYTCIEYPQCFISLYL